MASGPAEGGSPQSLPITGVHLAIEKGTKYNKNKCVICQTSKSGTKLSSTPSGVKRIRDAAEIRQDHVYKRLRLMSDNELFQYHVDNQCYKSYTLQKTLNIILQKKSENLPGVDPSETVPDDHSGGSTRDDSSVSRTLRTDNTSRPPPSCSNEYEFLKCIICNQERSFGQRVRTKFRVCEGQRAAKFLAATYYFQDDVFDRAADLDSEERIIAADVVAHNTCMKNYLLKYDRARQEGKTHLGNKQSPKFEAFLRVKTQLDAILDSGCGFTLSDVRDLIQDSDGLTVKNCEVKKFLLQVYDEQIQFCPSVRKYEPLLVFSSDLSRDDLARVIRSRNTVRDAGDILRKALLKVDFGLQDKFCDSENLETSWTGTKIPDALLTFFSSLFGVRKALLMQTEPCLIDEEQGEEEESGVAGNIRLHSIFQILYYHLHNGSKKTPLHVLTGHNVYDRCKSKELITSLNRIGVSTSYDDVLRSRGLLSSYVTKESKDQGVPMPSHFLPSRFTVGALDNFDFEDKSSISGKCSTHDTVMVLFQVVNNDETKTKPSVSSTGLERHCRTKDALLPCQQVALVSKPSVRPSLPDDFLVSDEVPLHAATEADQREFLISLTRVGLPDGPSSDIPTWAPTTDESRFLACYSITSH